MEQCKTSNSLLYHEGGGKSDGEVLKWLWAMLNQSPGKQKRCSWKFVMMPSRTRLTGITTAKHWNEYMFMLPEVGLADWLYFFLPGSTLQSWLTIAIKEHNIQIKEFQDIDLTLQRLLRAEWLKMVEEWWADRSKLSPYMPRAFGHRSYCLAHQLLLILQSQIPSRWHALKLFTCVILRFVQIDTGYNVQILRHQETQQSARVIMPVMRLAE